MNVRRSCFAVVVSALVAFCTATLAALAAPLTIKEQGSFFVGGEKKTVVAARRRPDPAADRRDHGQSDVRAVPDPDERRRATSLS